MGRDLTVCEAWDNLFKGDANTATHIQNSQLLKFMPEILNKILTQIIFLQITFNFFDINLFLNSGRILTESNAS